ncbi:MAG: HAMP domain-containing histidine kinase [Cyclobacteriaceae bacterium]
MSKSKLSWIIGLMSVALTGLVAFQWYWIDSVISSNEDRFQKDVMESLQAISAKLEKQEAMEMMDQHLRSRQLAQLSQNPPQQSIINSSNTTGVSFPNKVERMTDSVPIDNQVSFQFSFDENGGSINISSSGGVQNNGQMDPFRIIAEEQERFRKQWMKMANKQDMMYNVLEDLFSTRSIVSRIDQKELDSLLDLELSSRGIRIPYDFAVFQPQSARLISTNNPSKTEVLTTSMFKTFLFPNDLIGEPTILSINFPTQAKYLSSKIWMIMSSSGLLLLIVLFCFSYAVYTIIRQKKFSVMKNDFINNMTHEFKTPIATIGLAIEALQDTGISQEASMREKYLGVIGDENKRLGGQVEKVLQMARIDRNELKMSLKPVKVHELIEAAIEKINLQIEHKNGLLKQHLQADEDIVNGDETHLLNVILNLLDNAIKYSDDAPNIAIRTRSYRKELHLSIKDHGIGMSKDQVRHIFERFYRVSTGNVHNVKGFGLGLSYVKTVIEEHQGSVDVESDQGIGTNFIIKLPLTK